MRQLRNAIKNGGKREFQGYGDLSLTELLPALLTRYSETEMLIAAPAIPDQAADIIHRWMRKQWARMDGTGKIDVVTKLTIIADLSPEQSPKASEWLKENPFPGRLTLADKPVAPDQQALQLPDLAILGPLNLRYGKNFTCTATTVQEEVDALWKQYARLTRPVFKRPTVKKTAAEEEDGEKPEAIAPTEAPADKNGDAPEKSEPSE